MTGVTIMRGRGGDADPPMARLAVERYVESHLSEPGLTPATIAAAVGMSVRTLHRLFGRDGTTLGGYVRVRRLVHAGEDLRRYRGTRTISWVAHRWGFVDASHFSRAFKRHFGSNPSEYRNLVS